MQYGSEVFYDKTGTYTGYTDIQKCFLQNTSFNKLHVVVYLCFVQTLNSCGRSNFRQIGW